MGILNLATHCTALVAFLELDIGMDCGFGRVGRIGTYVHFKIIILFASHEDNQEIYPKILYCIASCSVFDIGRP